jgi:predicted nucleic acid-binding protein
MKGYWDSSALVASFAELSIRSRLRQEGGITRTHALAEVFSALTSGNLSLRVTADNAAEMVEQLAKDLEFIDLTSAEVLQALKQTRKRGVRGGRVHDFLHAVAAQKAGAPRLLTCDEHDFDDLTDGLLVEQV